jgi:hypothetical protein
VPVGLAKMQDFGGLLALVMETGRALRAPKSDRQPSFEEVEGAIELFEVVVLDAHRYA